MKEITEWEVLTLDGWQDFSGIVQFEKEVITITFDDGSHLTGSLDHRIFLVYNEKISLKDLVVGDVVQGSDNLLIVKEISEIKEKQNVYDLVEVQGGHKYLTNSVLSSNCDEIAFIPPRIQEEFMAGTGPALSATKGKMLITSTPNGNRDLFAKLWFGTGMEWDKKAHDYVRKGTVKNIFTPLFIPFWIDPTKNNDEWINREKKTLDSPTKWRVEFECLSYDTRVEVYDEIAYEYRNMTLREIYLTLAQDAMLFDVIIEPEDENQIPASPIIPSIIRDRTAHQFQFSD